MSCLCVFLLACGYGHVSQRRGCWAFCVLWMCCDWSDCRRCVNLGFACHVTDCGRVHDQKVPVATPAGKVVRLPFQPSAAEPRLRHAPGRSAPLADDNDLERHIYNLQEVGRVVSLCCRCYRAPRCFCIYSLCLSSVPGKFFLGLRGCVVLYWVGLVEGLRERVAADEGVASPLLSCGVPAFPAGEPAVTGGPA